jgi:hypothetical protein
MDAHHWNRQHFANEFIPIYRKAIESYDKIAQSQGVLLHGGKVHEDFIRRVHSEAQEDTLDLERFREFSLSKSQRSAITETSTEHRLELRGSFPKPLFEVENNLGGKYYLTADEIEFISEDEVIIRESKNTTRGVLPSTNDIKDGLFKLLLYSQLSALYREDRRLRFTAQIRLTGKFSGELSLPAEESCLQGFLDQFSSKRQRKSVERKLAWLNRELELLGIQAILRGNATSAGGVS